MSENETQNSTPDIPTPSSHEQQNPFIAQKPDSETEPSITEQAPYPSQYGAPQQAPYSQQAPYQQPYNGPQMQPQMQYWGPPTPEQIEGKRHADNSLIFGIISVFFMGIVFGPLAIMRAKDAEKFGFNATAGRTLGWIGIALFIFYVLYIIGVCIWAFTLGMSEVDVTMEPAILS